MSKRKAVGGSEEDAFSPWRPLLHWRRGELRKLKRKANKRERRQAKEQAMTERYTPEWDADDGTANPRPWWRRSFVTIYPADSDEGRAQIEAVADVLETLDGADYEDVARAALDALRGERND